MPRFERRSAEDSGTPKLPDGGRRFTDQGAVATVLGPGTRFVGQIQGKTHMEIQGTLEGSCQIEGLLRVTADGEVLGNVTATDVVVEGKVVGNVEASDRLELSATSRVEGDIRSSKLAMAEGCHVQGSIDMSPGNPGSSPAATFREKRKG